jgi:plastocyanin
VKRFCALALFAILVLRRDLPAASLNVTVKDTKGSLVSNAVVFAKKDGAKFERASKQVVIEQRDKQFMPYVTALEAGTSISFPNKDQVRHHVYSLSPAKKFELPLYVGTPSTPVLFDKEGFVTLGCNIHDWMVAYVAVLATPYFQVTGRDGRAMLRDLPPGKYTVEAWQPLLKGAPEQLAQHIDLTTSGTKDVVFTLEMKPDFRAKRAPGLPTGGYP